MEIWKPLNPLHLMLPKIWSILLFMVLDITTTNSLRITSSAIKKTFELATSTEVIFETNAFGNVDGGQLWDILDISITNYRTKGFPEEAFRLLLKSHFNKGHKSKFES